MRNWTELFDYRVKEKTVKPDSIDYCVKVDDKHVKLSWLALRDIRDISEHFLKTLEGKFVEDISYYLARDAMGQPVSKSEVAMGKKMLDEKMEKIHRRRLKQSMRRRLKKQQKYMKKSAGEYVIEFD